MQLWPYEEEEEEKKAKKTLAGIRFQFFLAFMVSILHPAKSFLQD